MNTKSNKHKLISVIYNKQMKRIFARHLIHDEDDSSYSLNKALELIAAKFNVDIDKLVPKPSPSLLAEPEQQEQDNDEPEMVLNEKYLNVEKLGYKLKYGLGESGINTIIIEDDDDLTTFIMDPDADYIIVNPLMDQNVDDIDKDKIENKNHTISFDLGQDSNLEQTNLEFKRVHSPNVLSNNYNDNKNVHRLNVRRNNDNSVQQPNVHIVENSNYVNYSDNHGISYDDSQNRSSVHNYSAVRKEHLLYKEAINIPFKFNGEKDDDIYLYKQNIINHQKIYNLSDSDLVKILL